MIVAIWRCLYIRIVTIRSAVLRSGQVSQPRCPIASLQPAATGGLTRRVLSSLLRGLLANSRRWRTHDHNSLVSERGNEFQTTTERSEIAPEC